MNRTKSLLLLMVAGVVSVALASASARAQPDVSHRESLGFEAVEVMRKIHEKTKNGNYEAISPAFELIVPVAQRLNDKYPVNGSSRSLGNKIITAAKAGEAEKLRRLVTTFLVLNLHDVMTIARDANLDGDRRMAQNYTKKALMTFKTTVEPRVRDPEDVNGALRKMNVALQEFNKYIGDPGEFNSSFSKAESALVELFPELDFTIERKG